MSDQTQRDINRKNKCYQMEELDGSGNIIKSTDPNAPAEYLLLNDDSPEHIVNVLNTEIKKYKKLYESTQRHVEILQTELDTLKAKLTVAIFKGPESRQYKNYPPTFSSYAKYQYFKNTYHNLQGAYREGCVVTASGESALGVLIEMADRLYKSTAYFLHDTP